MKNLSFFMSFLFAFTSFNINAQWIDSFNDGNLHQNPTWNGDTSHFIINQERLELNALNAGSAFLYTHFDLSATNSIEWNFEVNIEFSPSQNNGFKYILYSSDSLYWESSSINNSLCYYLEFGEIGSMDAVELYRIDSSSTDAILLCRGIDEIVSSAFHRKYKVIYNDGNWTIKSAPYNSPYFILEAEANEVPDELFTGYLGFELYYTSSNTNNFSFDDISVSESVEDTTAASYTNIFVLDSLHLQIDFSEALDSSTLNSNNYFLIEMLANPISVDFLNSEQTSIILEFENVFMAFTSLNLEIDDIEDIAGNTSGSMSINFSYYPEYEAQLRELQFSELMADPSPSVGLPNAEFIEIFNASDSTLQLENYILLNSGIERYLPESTLLADSFLLLCKSGDEDYFSDLGNVIGIENWVTLVNSGDSLILKNRSNQFLDKVNYSSSWFKSNLKKEGGWSLEKIAFSNSCYGASNWEESNNIYGGTPGISNSVLGEELEMDVFMGQVLIEDSNTIRIEVEGELDLLNIPSAMYSTSPPFEIIWELSQIEERELKLYCSPSFAENKDYHLQWQNVKTCDGKYIETEKKIFGIPKIGKKGDVVINEILFNPYSGANDFIEIINRSDKYIDLKSWRFNRMEGGFLVEDADISNTPLMIAPNEILAFSRDIEELPFLYPTCSKSHLRSINDLPNMKDDKGKLILVNQDFVSIDSLEYDEDMHFPLLEDLNGVSLERIHPDLESSAKSSWASASEKEGFASPGLQNSQFWEGTSQDLDIKIEPKLFTPNNDGDKDFMLIHYHLKEGGWQAKVNIYSKEGVKIKNLVENEWVSGKGVFKWNGLDNNNELLSVGIYVVYFEVFNSMGEVIVFKRPCVIGSEL